MLRHLIIAIVIVIVIVIVNVIVNVIVIIIVINIYRLRYHILVTGIDRFSSINSLYRSTGKILQRYNV